MYIFIFAIVGFAVLAVTVWSSASADKDQERIELGGDAEPHGDLPSDGAGGIYNQ